MKKILLLLIAVLMVISGFLFWKQNRLLFFLPDAKDENLVLKVWDLHIPGIDNVVNGSIEHYQDHYLMAFRISEGNTSQIGLIELDSLFRPLGDYWIVDVGSDHAEDARLLLYGQRYYLIYNDVMPINPFCRAMKIAELDVVQRTIAFSTWLDQHIKPVEKNWVPFIYEDQYMFAYNLVPHKILHLQDPQKNSLEHLIFPDNPCYRRFYWKWGFPRGGTPAKLIDGNFLSFFHSSYLVPGGKKYVMGAYSFQNHSPFCVLKVSACPIIFYPKFKTKVVFPAGFVEGVYKEREVLHLSVGIDDKTTQIITIDKIKLLDSFKTL